MTAFPRQPLLGLCLAVSATVIDPQLSEAAPATFTNVCDGLGVTLPTLNAVPQSGASTLGAALPAVNGVVNDINTSVVTPLSGASIRVGRLDGPANTYTNLSGTACNLSMNGLAVDNAGGIAVGGGQISGLGGTGGTPASSGSPSAIAFGNGATTAAGAANALAVGTGATASAPNSVALGAGSLALRGALPAYDAVGLAAKQSSAGEVSIGAAGALRQMTNLAAGSADTDAVNVGQLKGVSTALNDAATALGASVTGLGGRVSGLDTTVAGLGTAVTGLDTTTTGLATTVGSLGSTVSNLGSRVTGLDANVGALGTTTAALGAAAATALGGGSVYNPLLGTVTLPTFTIRGTLYASVGAALTAVDAALGTPAGPGGQGPSPGQPTTPAGPVAPFVADNSAHAPAPVASGLNSTAGGYGAVATGSNSVALGAGSTDGGQNNVVSVGSVGAERRIINVAVGQVSAGSTDAVTGGQLFSTNQQVAALGRGAVQYDRAADGSTLSSVTLGSDAGGPVVIHNLAAGVAASDAATVGQVRAVANTAVQYATVDGIKTNTVTLQGGSPGGVTIGNLAPGQQGTDAVNLNQLRGYSGSMLGQAQSYTDARISNLRALTEREVASARRDAAGGTALALAATGLHYDDRPGKFSLGGATAYYNGQMGLAFGVAGTSETGRVRVNAAISATPTTDHPDVGAVVGASIAIN